MDKLTNTQKAVEAILERSGMTGSELCRNFGKPPQFLTKYKNGERNMGINMFLGLCKVGGVVPSEILKIIGK